MRQAACWLFSMVKSRSTHGASGCDRLQIQSIPMVWRPISIHGGGYPRRASTKLDSIAGHHVDAWPLLLWLHGATRDITASDTSRGGGGAGWGSNGAASQCPH